MNLKQIAILERIVSMVMMLLLGFGLGTAFQRFNAFYWAAGVGICAFAKIELHHLDRKLRKRNSEQNPQSI